MTEPTEKRFLNDVAEHRMAVLRDDGLHRHLQFRRPSTYCMGFDIVTWPGYLAYTGDMGCFVFTRLPDMFEFFRTDRTHSPQDGRKLYINRGYWAEKCVAQDRNGIKVYSAEVFHRAVLDRLKHNGERLPPGTRAAVRDQVLSRADDGEHEAMRAAIDFEHEGFRFSDFWETDLREYTYHYVWCCYALAWAIEQYDAIKEPANA